MWTEGEIIPALHEGLKFVYIIKKFLRFQNWKSLM